MNSIWSFGQAILGDPGADKRGEGLRGWVKQVSHFSCPGHFFLVLVDDSVNGRLTWAKRAFGYSLKVTFPGIYFSRTTGRNVFRALLRAYQVLK